VAHSRKLKSFLKNKDQDLDLRERERGPEVLDLQECFAFLSSQQLKGTGGGLFVAPTSKRAIGKTFTGLVR
jgi:hypothetical protein